MVTELELETSKLEPEPPHTELTRNPALREKFENLYKEYEKGQIKTVDDIAIGLRVSRRTVFNTIKRLKWESSLQQIEEEAKEEETKKYESFTIAEDKAKTKYKSPITEVNDWIKRTLNDLRPQTRRMYIDHATRCWEYLTQKYGLYKPTLWNKKEVEEFIYSDEIRRLKKSSQNRVRTSINSLMKSLGKRDIFFPKLE